MATSRRRERELARRRYERRRQAEIERRAQSKRRNTILGAVIGTAMVIAVLLVLTFTVFTGGSSKKTTASVKPTTSASPSTSATPAPPAPTKCAAISPNPPAKGEPFIPPVKGKPSRKLVTKDIKVGHGTAAKSGSNVTVKYVGVSCDTGKVFDASYTDGAAKQELPAFPLGQGQVIAGWDQGLVGMKTGGVRELVIPASLAYKAAGSGKIKGNDTLIFVVTMEKIT
ncbi:MAG TPA: FKBP-type peptidyl-prolyl cis-trans isomerase [Mycobacteriales bacterium]|nr:FKBP-type peptidyl-prolyl cis-trans isomerase [Mycobacteriales bacterium]